jgi:hypothetical protein
MPSLPSTLISVLAFNLVFFIQELFLVLPKAFTPGLRPTLFHNNHHWEGTNPLASLFQGTGALATLITAALCAVWIKARPPRTLLGRLALLWIIFHGVYEALPQFVIGAFVPQNDVGMAMTYLQFSPEAKYVAAAVAVLAMAVIGVALARAFLKLASDVDRIGTPAKRAGFIGRLVTLPALITLPLLVPFRIPGALDQVILAPVIMTFAGILFVQMAAPLVRAEQPAAPLRAPPVGPLLVLVLIQLLIFQLVLRPGIHFGQ